MSFPMPGVSRGDIPGVTFPGVATEGVAFAGVAFSGGLVPCGVFSGYGGVFGIFVDQLKLDSIDSS